MDLDKLVDEFRVRSGAKISLNTDFDPANTGGLQKKTVNADELLEQGVEMLSDYQEKLYAENRRSLLIIIQAMDAAGKDSVIAHVMSGVNPTGCRVHSFKAPSEHELDHDYLWRCSRVLPERGMIGIFNRSYYEEVLVVRVHPHFLDAQRLPPHTLGKELWNQRFEEINNFERYLVNQGTEILKIFLHVSKDEQRQRQLDRIDRPDKHWKFDPNDIDERAYWDDYIEAYEEAFSHTSTEWAPWYILPADKKWFTRIAAATVIAQKLKDMDPHYPTVSEEDRQEMLAARAVLMGEDSE